MKKTLLAIIIFALAGTFYFFGQKVVFVEQWSLYEALRTTAAIIFGVMGAWIAIVYPNSLTKIFDKNYDNKSAEIQKIKRLLFPLTVSTSILAIVLLLGLLAPIIRQIDFFAKHAEIVRGMSFSTLGILTLVQLWTLIVSLAPGESLLFELAQEDDKSKTIKRLKSNIKK